MFRSMPEPIQIVPAPSGDSAPSSQNEDIDDLNKRFENREDREELEAVANKMQSLFKKKLNKPAKSKFYRIADTIVDSHADYNRS